MRGDVVLQGERSSANRIVQIFILIWLPFPPYMPVTGVNMNYAGPIFGFVILFALLDWFVTGKRRFVFPTENVFVNY